jgi:predicted transcriptional regulator
MTATSRTPKQWKPPEDDTKSVIFVRSELDEYGLDVYEFRVLAHVARREGKNKQGKSKGCFAKQKTIAEICGMSHRKAQSVLSVLCEAGLLEIERQIGSTNIYKVAPPSKWKSPENLSQIRKRYKSSKEPATPQQSDECE